jgi:hypothetical protein
MSREETMALYNKATGTECTIMRLSSNPNSNGSFAYAHLGGELPIGAKTYGKDGRVIIYLKQMVGGLNKEHKANLACIERPNTTTKEIYSILLVLKSEAEKKAEESFRREVAQDSKEASVFGITKQELGRQYFASKYGAKFGSVAQVTQLESAEA